MAECMDDGTNGWSVEDEAADNDFGESTEEETLEAELEAPVSAEPIPIAAPEPGEIVISEEPEETGHLTELVCESCLELNLTTKSTILCARCDRAFCLHYASRVDAQYCVNCCSDISITKEVITKTYEHKNQETGAVSFYRRRARQYKVGGLDWLFSQRKIHELSDVELDLSIEYHRNILSLMIAEQERRRNEKMHRYAGMKVSLPKKAKPPADPTTVTESTTVKKTRTVSKDKQMEQLKALLDQMKKKGVGVDALAKAMKEKK